MPSRSDKERVLRRNVEINTERAIRTWESDNRESAPDHVKKNIRKGFEDSARRIDRNINDHFNGE